MNNFYKRTLTGIAFVAVLVSAILIHATTFFALFALIVTLGIFEFYRIIDGANVSPNKLLGGILGTVFFAVSCLYASDLVPVAAYWVVVPFISAIFVAELYRKQASPFQNIAVTLFGALYVAVPFSLLVLFGFPEQGITAYQSNLILGFFFLLWSSDTGAYLTGVSIGKHPMFPRISPKKSWEGFAGGIVLTLFVAFIISNYFTALTLIDWLVIAVIICIFGVWGDLVESMLKRSLNIKDSGNILPGHGGILDRFDSVLFSAPIVFLYLQIKNYLMLF
ncbi:MAG: phosphatidate cytidylyltransferase [Bacteroidota bacterium]|nr:phosphatidate cytidylyltransferase [Bacteroidota bacterium]